MRRLALGATVLLSLGGATQAQQQRAAPPAPPGAATAIRAGRLVDPDAGTAAANQIILVQDGTITAVGGNVTIPAGAQVIDLSGQTVLPGLVEAHNHLTMTLVETVPLYGSAPKFGDRVFDSSPLLEMFVTDTTAYRALEGAGNAFTLLDHGFTLERDLGNAGLYADTALRQAIEAGWIPGDRTVDRLKAAYRIGVKSVFSTDFDYYVPGMTRGDEVIDALITWKAAGIPAKDILKAMTTYGYQVLQVEHQRGPIKAGLAADIIAVNGDPLSDVDVLRKVAFVMKDGKVFKQNGVATPSRFYK